MKILRQIAAAFTWPTLVAFGGLLTLARGLLLIWEPLAWITVGTLLLLVAVSAAMRPAVHK